MSDELQPLPDLSAHKDVRLDFETTGLKWWKGDRPIGAAYLLPATGERGYIPFGHYVGPNHDPEKVREWGRRELVGKHITNIKTNFDIHMAREFGVDLAAQGCTFADVAHNAALLDDNRYTFNLDHLVRDFLPGNITGKLKTVEGIALDKTRMATYPAGLVAPYAIRDVELVDLLDVETMRRITEEDLLRVWQLENDVIPVVCEMEKNGAPIDMDLLAQWEKETREELEAAVFSIYRATGIRFGDANVTLPGIDLVQKDPSFPLDLCRRLFRIRGVPIPEKVEYENGVVVKKESFEDDLLSGIADPVIQTFRYAKQIGSLRSKAIVNFSNIVGSDGIIRYGLHQLASDEGGTVSGRFSSSGKDARKQVWGINAQQVFSIDNQLKTLVNRWLVRRLFVPGSGQWFRADARQIEYRLFAHYADSPKINAVYAANPDADFHDTVMELLNTVFEINRKHTKNVNFACVFGAGTGKFSEMCGLVDRYDWRDTPRGRFFGPIPNARATNLYNGYMTMFPEVKPLLQRAAGLAESRGHVRTALGRRARLQSRFYSALNRIIQGTAAEVNKRKLVEVYRNRELLEFIMRLTVHDELDGDLQNPAKLAMLHELLNTQDSIDGRGLMSRIPLLWETEAADNWATNYRAKATKLHKEGKLTADALAGILR